MPYALKTYSWRVGGLCQPGGLARRDAGRRARKIPLRRLRQGGWAADAPDLRRHADRRAASVSLPSLIEDRRDSPAKIS